MSQMAMRYDEGGPDRTHPPVVTVAMRGEDPLRAMVEGWLRQIEIAEPGAGEWFRESGEVDLAEFGISDPEITKSILHGLDVRIAAVRPALYEGWSLVDVVVRGCWVDGWGTAHRFDFSGEGAW